jgi:hypothetical protein
MALMPKMDFPMFDGTDVRIEIDKCSGYFAFCINVMSVRYLE